MGGLRSGVVTAIAVACAIVAAASCSYGTYDGGAGDAEPESLVIAFTPGAGVTRQTSDRFLFVQIPPDAFATATTVQVTRLPDRRSTMTFPVFQIAADAPLTGRVALQFNASGTQSGNPNLDPFAVGRLDNGNFVPLSIDGVQQNVVWGVTSTLGTFTVDRAPVRGYDRQGNAFKPSCFDKCCGNSNLTTNQTQSAGGTRAGCYCMDEQGGGGPEAAVDLQCFLACADPAGEAARCSGRAFVEGTIECVGAAMGGGNGCMLGTIGGPLTGTPPCCIQQANMGPGTICGLSGCTNSVEPIRRCGSKGNCASGECCLFPEDNEYRCAATCTGQKR